MQTPLWATPETQELQEVSQEQVRQGALQDRQRRLPVSA
jgi:hypothetical protein